MRLPPDLQRKVLEMADPQAPRNWKLLCKVIRVTLPWPPSVNHCYRAVGNKVVLSRKGRQYPRDVLAACTEQRVGRVQGILTVSIWAYPPDRRKRDCDNLLKASLDALCKAGVFEDDEQVQGIHVYKRGVVKGGRLEVEINGE